MIEINGRYKCFGSKLTADGEHTIFSICDRYQDKDHKWRIGTFYNVYADGVAEVSKEEEATIIIRDISAVNATLWNGKMAITIYAEVEVLPHGSKLWEQEQEELKKQMKAEERKKKKERKDKTVSFEDMEF